MTGTTSPMRRVLGDRSTNASLRIQPQDSVLKPNTLSSTTPQSRTAIEQAVRGWTGTDVTPKAGQKRHIEEVDGIEERLHVKQDRSGSASPLNSSTSDDGEEEEEEKDSIRSTIVTKLTPHTIFSSFHASQEPPIPLEDQFDIQEEMSQQTLEKVVSGFHIRSIHEWRISCKSLMSC